MDRADLDTLVANLAAMARQTFVARTKRLDEIDPLLQDAGFADTGGAPGRDDVGPLRIYERVAPA